MSHPMNRATPSRLRHIVTLTATLAATALLSLAAHAQSVEGEVKRIDPDSGKVTLKHGEIKNLDMPAMQMSFRVADPAWLKTLQVGDKVKFDAAKVNGQFTITAITVAK
ncbi:copper-binding protein [Aquabacterium sp.]|uniref:copper-binding protein n=1 Tax=Aquabacterium sp. TaxID=1872578 RepID=UPI002487D022|nr:copper-binding protein [Aquabacterium sp.]MDI1349947.1 copper-binding protein [Aquabacterium sp.]